MEREETVQWWGRRFRLPGQAESLPLEFVHFSSGGSGDVVPISWV
jgi:hypothetical protein